MCFLDDERRGYSHCLLSCGLAKDYQARSSDVLAERWQGSGLILLHLSSLRYSIPTRFLHKSRDIQKHPRELERPCSNRLLKFRATSIPKINTVSHQIRLLLQSVPRISLISSCRIRNPCRNSDWNPVRTGFRLVLTSSISVLERCLA
jgi:hypothetical protein